MITAQVQAGEERWLSGEEPLLYMQRLQVWFPDPTRWLKTTCKFSFKGSNALFWPPQVPGTQCTDTHADKALININNNYINKVSRAFYVPLPDYLPCLAFASSIYSQFYLQNDLIFLDLVDFVVLFLRLSFM